MGFFNWKNFFNFTRYSNFQGQTCFTFNGFTDPEEVLRLNETGLNMAFKLELDLILRHVFTTWSILLVEDGTSLLLMKYSSSYKNEVSN